ncbi:uncharacterized protein LOC123511588 isoform X3 [Portunus trituberculatus]|uniref:uncharacterized protein LOC123511588 isoform X3 n=1 Tax=Portunus trituberculatus TaxID=210409 RepID=UPI001E1CD961|nr:uncharacterized protein LOC123511588 isoform X3 [Portunus trituberculatus]
MTLDGDEEADSSGVEADEVLVKAYCAVLHEWCAALQVLLGRQGDARHALLLSPTVAGLWALFLKRRELLRPLQRQAQTRDMREENTGVLRLINILKKSSMSSPGGRCHRATHRRSAATDKNTSTSVFPKTTAATTVDAKKGKKCLERPVLGSHDKDFPSRPTAGWRAACELHRRSSRLKERQHVAHIHYEDLSLEEEEKEDISASSGSDQEYQPHHPRDSHSLTRKTKAQRRNQTSMPLMKGHCGWSSEEWKREGDKEGTRVKGAATRKGSNGERSPYTSHTHQGEEETYITTQAHGDETSTLAEEVIALRRLPQHKQETAWEGLAKKEVPAVECQAAAALLVALKMCCGLNDSSEHHLSFVAARVNGVMMGDALQHPPVRPLFSFDEWMRYLVEVAWLSRQVNPLCEAIAPPPVLAKPLETKLMADLAHLLTFCSTDPAASIPDLENYPNMRRQLEGLGLPLEKLWQAHIIALSAPHDPLLGTLERYVERYTSSSSSSTTRHRHQQESSTRLLRRAQELLQTTFSSTQLFWTQHLHQIQQQLKEHGSSLCLKPVKYPHSLCPLPLKPDGKRRHYTKATANTRHRERKHTHSVATGSSQGMRGVLDERHTVNTSDLVNNSSSCVGVQVKSTPAASLCRALQYRQDSLATSGRKRCHTSSQKSYIRNGKVCQCKNMKRLDKKDQYWRDWNCVHTQSMYSWGKQKYNLMDRKDSCMEEQCGKNHIPNCTTKYGKRNSMKERKKSSQGKQHREGCCHKNTEDFPPQNRNINKPKNSHERHCTLISAEICSHKEEERINYDKGAHIIKRNSRNFKFLHGGYFPVYKNQAKENSEGFSVPAGKNKNKTTAKGENKGSGVSCASEYTRGQRSHITKDLMRKGMNRSTNKSTNFLYMPIEKDTSSKSRYPPGEEDGSQRRNTGIPYTIPHSPEDKVYPWRKKEAHPSTSLSSDDEDAITSSTSSHTSSNSSILAHESLDQLLKDGTSATVLSHTLFVPVPAYRMWQGLDITKDKWKQVWSGLPRSYRCVVEVLVALCGMTCRELLEEVQAMEKMVEIYSSLLFLFPNAL